MKFLIILILTFNAFADVSLDDAYRREKAFLLSQKEALIKMRGTMVASLIQRKSRAQKDITQNQNELSQIMLANQGLDEEYRSIEKMTKESSQVSGQLEKNQLKIQENLQLIRAKLGLGHIPSTETDTVKSFEATLGDAFNLIKNLAAEKWRSHAFLDEDDHLVQGEILFQGLFSAYGKLGSKIYTLSPYNNEFLKVIAPTSGDEIYMFTPNFEKTNLMAAKSWKESVADAIPGLAMGIIMLAILGLFILLARA